MNEDFFWLLQWFNNQCDGDWEHGNGIKIGTIDNPGWFLKVSISETELEKRYFPKVDINRTDTNWLYCSVDNGIFEGFGGPFNLPEIINVFKKWATENNDHN